MVNPGQLIVFIVKEFNYTIEEVLWQLSWHNASMLIAENSNIIQQQNEALKKDKKTGKSELSEFANLPGVIVNKKK